MQDKVLKLMTAICLLLNMSIAFSAEEKIEISVKKSDTIQDSRGGLPATKEGPFSFLLNGMRQAITAELTKNEEVFLKINTNEKRLLVMSSMLKKLKNFFLKLWPMLMMKKIKQFTLFQILTSLKI